MRIGVIIMLCASTSLQAQSTVDLGLLSKGNETFRYVAIGSSLSAGVRDGGVYAEAQETAFPALLAKQMGIANFRQALLPGTGTGRKYATLDRNGVLDIQKVPGLFDDSKKDAQLPKVVGEVDNLAVPYLKALSLGLSEDQTDGWSENFSKKEFTHMARLNDVGKEKKQDYKSLLVDKNLKQVSFFTFEMGIQDFVDLFNKGAYLRDVSFLMNDREGYFPEDNLLKMLIANGAKGVITNIPEVYLFPFYAQNRYQSLKAKLGREVYIERYNKNDIRLANDYDFLISGTEGLQAMLDDSWIRGDSKENPLLDEEVIGIEERYSVQNYNGWLATLARQNNLPIVDLYTVYDKILNGEYQTDDGVIADPSYPYGNFFSSDGITPTAFGQAIIANEFIKTINAAYKTDIPLVATKSYIFN